MKIIRTQNLDLSAYGPQETHWIYNAFDSLITNEILDVIRPQLDSNSRKIYEFEKALQGPAIEMMRRGILIDQNKKDLWLDKYETQVAKLEKDLNLMAEVVWGKGLNSKAPIQLMEFFYRWMNVPVQYKYEKGVRKATSNRDALEAIENYFYPKPFALNIMKQRDVFGKVKVLRYGVDSDGRFRHSINIGGTESGRWSTSGNAFGRGASVQNLTEELREVFIADPGYKLAYIDLEQAESRAVAYLSGDLNYINACESDDLHVYCCKLIWPDLGWTGDPEKDLKTAEKLFYRHYTYRYMTKRGGHATNYFGKPRTISKQLHVQESLVQAFQEQYFREFPGIPQWHQATITELQTQSYLITPFGRKRCFFGRLWDEATWREAIAYKPQSLVADYMNTGLLKLWLANICQLLLQLHDAVLIQYPEEDEAQVLEQARKIISFPLQVNDRELIIPTDVKVGWNWNKWSKDNPDGLKTWKGSDERKREETPPASILESRVS